jgi:hypothetical protein
LTQTEPRMKIKGADTTLLEKGLVKTTYADACIINANSLESIRTQYTLLAGGEDLSSIRLLIVFEGRINVSRDIGQRYLTERVRPKIGEAFVATNGQTAEYLKGASAVMKTSHPVRFFENEGDAKNWLLSL